MDIESEFKLLYEQSIVIEIGRTLHVDAFSATGVLLLGAGQVIEDTKQVSRLLDPDTRFGKDGQFVLWKKPCGDGDEVLMLKRAPKAAPPTCGHRNTTRPDIAPRRAADPPEDNQPHAVQCDTPSFYQTYMASSYARPQVQTPPEPPVEEAKIPSTFRRAHAIKSEAINQVQSVFDRIESSGELSIDETESTVSILMDQVTSDGMAMASLSQLKDADNYTYSHSVNVCILGMYLALTTSYEHEIRQIGIGGLLHDVGKLQIPLSVLRKSGPLDAEERKIIQEHPSRGLELLRSSGCTDAIVLSCVLDHHEKQTGHGYPRHKAACEISPYAKMISLADVFDALTTDRPYRRAMSARDALMLMVRDMGNEFDPWLLHRFVEVIGSIASQTTVTPDGHIILNEGSQVTPIVEIKREVSAITGLDMVA